jgi:hypothetical protein
VKNMNESICELAREQVIRDDRWRRHASGCSDCREILAVAEWMTTLSGSTAVTRDLPAAGYLLFKAQMQKRRSDADRAALPIHAMIIVAGILIAGTMIGIMFGAETRLGSIMIDAITLLSSYAGVMVSGAMIVAVVCAAAGYFGNLTKDMNRRSRNN